MQLVGLSFQNYKAFHARESIEIRPLTLLIGRNSSGKSAVARLPLLLAATAYSSSPISLSHFDVSFGASFLDLIHNRRPHLALELGATFEEGGDRFELYFKVQYFEDLRLQTVAQMYVDIPERGRLSLRRLGADPLEDPAPYSLMLDDEVLGEQPVSFRGLTPVLTQTRKAGTLPVDVAVYFGSKILNHFNSTAYLGPFRNTPQREYAYPEQAPRNVGWNGTQAAQMLGHDSLRGGGSIVKAVGAWYEKNLGGWVLDTAPRGDTFALVLRNPREPGVEVNLVETGTGLAQVLPIVVQRQFENVTGQRDGLDIVEHPELHMHPGAHGDLADLYIEAARQGKRFIVETHSENFILRVRRRVAEHHRNPASGLDPNLVRIYWIDDAPQTGSGIKPIEILPDGEVSDWPEGVFSEDFEEVCAIREAQGTEEP